MEETPTVIFSILLVSLFSQTHKVHFNLIGNNTMIEKKLLPIDFENTPKESNNCLRKLVFTFSEF